MDKMSFSSLVESFSVEFELITPADASKGKYVSGEWVRDDNEPIIKSGAIIPYDNKTIYQSGGTLTSNDRQLAFIGDIPLDSVVIDGKQKYKVVSSEPYAEHYADVNLYSLKAVENIGYI